MNITQIKYVLQTAASSSMREAATKLFVTSIIVIHELEFALEVADKILFLSDGGIVEEGPAKEVLKNPKDERTVKFLGHFADKLEYVI